MSGADRDDAIRDLAGELETVQCRLGTYSRAAGALADALEGDSGLSSIKYAEMNMLNDLHRDLTDAIEHCYDLVRLRHLQAVPTDPAG